MLTYSSEYLTPQEPDYAMASDYNIEGLPILISKQQLSKHSNGKTFPHWNRDLEIIYVYEGSMALTVNGQVNILHPRDICLIEPGALHFFHTVNEEDCRYIIGLINETVFFSSPKLTQKYINYLFHSHKPKGLVFPTDSCLHASVEKILQEFYSLTTNRAFGFELLIAAKSYELLGVLFSIPNEDLDKIGSIDQVTANCFRRILDYIMLNYQNKISTEELCRAGNISRNRCFKLFQEFLGESPASVVMHYRLNQALTLLRDDTLSILDVAINCGFSQQSHFTHHFTRQYGITPLQFRKSHKKSRKPE